MRTSAVPSRSLLLLALLAWTLLPISVLVFSSFGDSWFYPHLLPTNWTTAAWREFVSDRRLLRALLTSLWLALLTGGAASIVGFEIGRRVSRIPVPLRYFAMAAAFVPVAAPPLALGIGLQYFVLRAGLGGTLIGVWLAHSVVAIGYTTVYFIGAFAVFDHRVEEEARSLGASPLVTLARVTLPLHQRQLAEALLLGFLVSWAQVPLTLLIGQGAVESLATSVMSYVHAGQDHLASVAGLLLALPGLVLMGVVGSSIGRFTVATV
ncbi:MAG: ABC transporter permease subunit [Gemmatimonadaceae bacterium]|nr:ABC transporter permease subunit [Gemmatimonadaceae bacterium]